MGAIRRAAVAGQFYQNEADALRSTVAGYLADAAQQSGPPPKAIIAPHAGFVYSGAIAASAYATIAPNKDKIRRVILLGPCHRVAVRGLALSSADAFETPLGPVEIDTQAIAQIEGLTQVQVYDATHEREHSLEVHLPFLQVVLDDFKIVPLVVGEASPADVAEVLETLWGGEETLIVVSSDLSHYLDYASAQTLDRQTSAAIEQLDPSAIGQNGACGRFPVGGLLEVAKRHGMQVTTLDVRNSGDTAGTKDRVVGYGAWIFTEPATEKPEPVTSKQDSPSPQRRSKVTLQPTQKATPSPEETPKRPKATITLKPTAKPASPAGTPVVPAKAKIPTESKSVPVDEAAFEQATRQLLADHGANLLLLAAFSIDHGLSHGKAYPVNLEDHPAVLREKAASFITLKKKGALRGCIGSPEAHRPLLADVSENAFRAAFADPRFPKLEADEREEVELSISVLSPQSPMDFANEQELLAQLRPGTDGLVIEDGAMRALFLPSVWSQLPRPEDFLRRLKIKAGMPPNHWSDTFQARRFIAAETSTKDMA